MNISKQEQEANKGGFHALWSPRALDLLQKRYFTNGITAVDPWLEGVCEHVLASSYYTEPELKAKWRERYLNLLGYRRFLPTSACLHNSLKGEGGLAGCMVMPLPSDTRSLVEETLPQIFKVLLAGTGVGMDLSVIPPRLWQDLSTQRAAPGLKEVLILLTTAPDGVVAYAGFKRPAFMASVRVNHPDLFEFIFAKRERELRNVNTSIAIDADFLAAYHEQRLLPVFWSHVGEPVYLSVGALEAMERRALERYVALPDLFVKDGCLFSRVIQRQVGVVAEDGQQLLFDPQVIFEVVAESAHACGDPGLINLAAINADNPTHPQYLAQDDASARKAVGLIQTTTPCGEQPLLPYEVCHLGSINLRSFVTAVGFDFAALAEACADAVRFMDDAITVAKNELAECDELAQLNRKIGLGVMGLADVFALLELAYASGEALALADKIMSTIREVAEATSEGLAEERGSFLAWQHSRFKAKLRRHATLLTIAPTGHISMLAECSTSIEPYFALAYLRQAGSSRLEVVDILHHKLQAAGYSLDQWLCASAQQIEGFEFNGSLQALVDDPSSDEQLNARLRELKRVFVIAHDLSVTEHITMVALLQRHVDNGISKTINLAEDASVEDVKQAYWQALNAGLKGVTIFRDKCLSKQALVRIAPCPSCFKLDFLEPNDCGGFDCQSERGGCGYAACAYVN